MGPIIQGEEAVVVRAQDIVLRPNNYRLFPLNNLPLFSGSYADIARVTPLVYDAIINCLANGTALFVNMQTVRVETFAKVWAKLDEAVGQLFRRHVQGFQGANTGRVGEPATSR